MNMLVFRKRIYGDKIYLEDNEYIPDIRVNYVNKSKYMLLDTVLSNNVLKIIYRYKYSYIVVKVAKLSVIGNWLVGTVIDAHVKPAYNKSVDSNTSNNNDNNNNSNNSNSNTSA